MPRHDWLRIDVGSARERGSRHLPDLLVGADESSRFVALGVSHVDRCDACGRHGLTTCLLTFAVAPVADLLLTEVQQETLADWARDTDLGPPVDVQLALCVDCLLVGITRTGARIAPTREQLPPSLRFAVLARDKFTCQYCGRSAPDVSLHIDHVVPLASGGANSITNLKTACSDCNLGKGKWEWTT
jgi:5-methylcytosine-specific restriction endonuclease McrA